MKLSKVTKICIGAGLIAQFVAVLVVFLVSKDKSAAKARLGLILSTLGGLAGGALIASAAVCEDDECACIDCGDDDECECDLDDACECCCDEAAEDEAAAEEPEAEACGCGCGCEEAAAEEAAEEEEPAAEA